MKRTTSARPRRPIGAEPVADGVHFRVWAPSRRAVAVVIDDRDFALDPDGDGYFAGVIDSARAGTLYRFRLDGERETYPDPASRFQPDGPHGASMVIDPAAYAWHDAAWKGIGTQGLVMYEMHVGTFTPEGTWRAAAEHFDELRDVGVNVIEMMPINDFPGRFGWGYDGVDLWAPTRLYGRPDDLRAFVDAAHRARIAVILDVVYNHLGPDGCFLAKFSDSYFTKRYENEWGDAINFDGDGSAGVREFFTQNAGYWIDEFHLDGLRLDATQSIIDNGKANVIAEITRCARDAAGSRPIFIVAENEPQRVQLIEEFGVDALWNDDWHHAAAVAATGRAEAYYTDYRGTAQEFVSMAKYGFLFQGQRYAWQKNRRGSPSLHVPAPRLVCYLQNHDQVANSARGERLPQLTSPGRFRALTALLLLGPNTPLLFQGQEFAASAPFLYFADHNSDLAQAVAKGRREFLTQFPSLAVDAVQRQLASPASEATFAACKLDHRERALHPEALALHRDLLRLRRDDPVFAAQRNDWIDGAVLGEHAFVLRFMPPEGDHRLLVVNLGADLRLHVIPEPLLAPPRGTSWQMTWTSGAWEYGGSGTPAIEDDDGWLLPAECAVVLAPSCSADFRMTNVGRASARRPD